jgi:alkylmercury lyase
MTTYDLQQQIAFFHAQLEDDHLELLPPLVRLLAEGEPVALERLAAQSGMTVEQVRAAFAKDPGTEWDEQGRIAGYGLTLRATPHSVRFGDRTLYGWCATDVLIAPAILGETGIVESTCPATRQGIRAEVTPESVVAVDPPDAVVSEVRPTEKVADIRAETCGLGHFFSSREAAAGWLKRHPQGLLHSVADDFAIHRQVFAEFGGLA